MAMRSTQPSRDTRSKRPLGDEGTLLNTKALSKPVPCVPQPASTAYLSSPVGASKVRTSKKVSS